MPRIPLPPITDFEAYNKNTKDQYEALGRFVVAFEAMVNEVRNCCIDLLNQAALVDIAFHHPALTAKPLFEILRALIIESLEAAKVSEKDKGSFRGVLRTIAAEYFELVNTRNTLVHGTWHIGYSSNEDPNSENFFLNKYTPTSEGLKKQDVPKNAFELLALKDRCEDTRTWVTFIHGCVPGPDRPHENIDGRFRCQDGIWQLIIGEGTVETLPRKPRE